MVFLRHATITIEGETFPASHATIRFHPVCYPCKLRPLSGTHRRPYALATESMSNKPLSLTTCRARVADLPCCKITLLQIADIDVCPNRTPAPHAVWWWNPWFGPPSKLRTLPRKSIALVDRDFTYVNLHEQRFHHWLVIAFIGANTTLGGEDDAVNISIGKSIVETWRAPENIHSVVMPAKETVGTEAGDLFLRMTLHVIWKSDLQPPPGLAIHLNGSDLFCNESGLRVKKGRI